MNRLSWDTTAPRRTPPWRRHGEPQIEIDAVQAEAELIRPAWDKRGRIAPF